jgi:c(7)-type cytochrome triheme protein
VRRLRGWACLALFALAGAGGRAAEPPRQLAFLRAYSQPEAPAPQKKARPSAGDEARRPLRREDFYDPGNPDLAHLQRHDEAMATLPRDANGFPDWMRALREGLIEPRAGLAPGAAMDGLDLDVIMKNTKEMPYVRFPHKAHTMWLDCGNCHPRPFEPRAGSARIAMADIFRGKYCGMCHDRVAFITFFSCQRCHSVPQQR